VPGASDSPQIVPELCDLSVGEPVCSPTVEADELLLVGGRARGVHYLAGWTELREVPAQCSPPQGIRGLDDRRVTTQLTETPHGLNLGKHLLLTCAVAVGGGLILAECGAGGIQIGHRVAHSLPRSLGDQRQAFLRLRGPMQSSTWQ